MLYVKSEEQLNDLSEKLHRHLRAPLTRIRSAIAKSEGYSHIAAFKEACASRSNEGGEKQLVLSGVEMDVLLTMQAWFVDCLAYKEDLEIQLDGERPVTFEDILPVLEKVINKAKVKDGEETRVDIVRKLKKAKGTLDYAKSRLDKITSSDDFHLSPRNWVLYSMVTTGLDEAFGYDAIKLHSPSEHQKLTDEEKVSSPDVARYHVELLEGIIQKMSEILSK